ncbi:hypothetical protein Palpr_1005 [Paludibacter propionicigenes WB4]|uniref:Uncharacterized protein n=1 Tax=Paludibacter propionicigenes (strain DSM 17365 / JCM 13257 / WB4) TaxID=694427 RepID=E4T361_PALPW|nr:hypothetical protein [Paludibacter propionicigenes]ADQ79155.1 hypothetical protein Palpr_1005 [Paludibacter propionicigenes WB4]
MNEAKSFIGEYTIGLSIAPYMKNILKEKFKYVTPIFPWMTREGSNISKYLHKNDQFKILEIYPRRPKLTTKSNDIEFKINAQIIAGASSGLKLGIPIIACCPLVKNFWELSDNPEFIWVKLKLEKDEDMSIGIKENESFNPKSASIYFVNNSEILDYIESNSKLFSIEKALLAFREINMESSHLDFYPRLGFGGIYKPIYFLLKEL